MNVKRTKIIITTIFLIGMAVAFTFLILDLMVPIKESISIGNLNPIKDEFETYGFWAPFFLSLTQSFLILLTVVPGTPIQLIAGVTLGPVIGFVAMLIGVFIGNIIVYLLVHKLGSKLTQFFSNKELEKVELLKEEKEQRVLSRKIMILYFIPIVPYGLIAFTVANSKMKFWRYMFITTLGTIPSILISVSLGTLIINTDYTVTLILFLALIVLTILTGIYYRQIIDLFTKKQVKNMEFFQNNAIKPKPILYTFLLHVMKIFLIVKTNFKHNAKPFRKYKKPYILIFNHPSALDFGYSFVPMYPNKVNAITAYYYFCNFKLGRLIHNLGCFPKFLFQPDISGIKNIKKVIKWKGILGIAPEGRLSAYGTLESITPATSKLLKHLNVPILLSKIEGAYLTKPKWASNIRRGRVDVTFQEIFSQEQISQMTTEEIDKVLYEKMYYDDFAWQEKNHVYFKGKKFAEGLEQILYICPVCKHEYTTETKDDHLYCTHCGTDIKLNHYYEFETDNKQVPKNIRDWYLYQKDVEGKRIEDPNYQLESNVTLKFPDPKGKGFSVVGSGKTTLTHQGVRFVGTIHGEYQEIDFKIQNIPAIPFGVKEDFEIYHHNTLYYFIPENIRECVKWSIVGELIHNKYLKDNNLE